MSNPLIAACHDGHITQVKQLIKITDVNQADEEGFTPLIVAAQGGYTKIIKLLLKNGAFIKKWSFC